MKHTCVCRQSPFQTRRLLGTQSVSVCPLLDPAERRPHKGRVCWLLYIEDLGVVEDGREIARGLMAQGPSQSASLILFSLCWRCIVSHCRGGKGLEGLVFLGQEGTAE